jgi:hypothetical protein
MSRHDDATQPETTFSMSIGIDDESLRDLLLHPETPVELSGGSRPRFAFARVGLVVATISGLCLMPVATLADGVVDPATPEPTCVVGQPTDPQAAVTLEETADCEDDEAVAPAEPDAPPASADPAPEPSAPEPAVEPQAPEPSPASSAQAAPAAAATPGKAASASAAEKQRTATAEGQPRESDPRTTSGETSTKTTGKRSAKKVSRHTRGRHRDAAKAAKTPATTHITQGSGEVPFFVTDEPVIPRFLIGLYKEAGKRYHIPWPVLAAINEIETDFGRNVAVSSAGATGWMQFMPATWRAYGVDADKDGEKDPDNPRDAIFAAARYLYASGAPVNMRRAIFAYNHAGWYVDSVLLRAERIAEFQGERSRSLKRLLRAGERKLVSEVLDDERITIYGCGREDIAARRIDRRVLVALRFLAYSGLHPTVTSLDCGHSTYTTSGNISAHSYGAAVDIAAINGIPIMGNQGAGSVTDATIRELLTLRGTMKPNQIISLMTFQGADNTLAMGDHADHIHVGFRALPDIKRAVLDLKR